MEDELYQVAILLDGENTKITKAANVGEPLRPPMKKEFYVGAGMRTNIVEDVATLSSGYLVQTTNSVYLFANVPADALEELMAMQEEQTPETEAQPDFPMDEPPALDPEDYEEEWR